MDIKDILKERRLALGLSMKELAERVGVSEGTISRWESGDIENMRRDKIATLAKVLGISPLTLLDLEEAEPASADESYYLDPEVAERMDAMKDRPELKVLFDASRKLSKEDVEQFAELMQKIAPKQWDD